MQSSLRTSLEMLDLDACILTWSDDQALGTVLSSCPNLEVLGIQLLPMSGTPRFVESEGASWSDLCLRRCERLWGLDHQVLTNAVPAATEIFEACLSVIRTCPPSLRHVSLHILPITEKYTQTDPSVLEQTDLGGLRWDKLDDVLSQNFCQTMLHMECTVVPGKCDLLNPEGCAMAARHQTAEAYLERNCNCYRRACSEVRSTTA
ncbi:hypothetical protein C8T65DRAFT_649881 [Cerioporus squamosus]|nr:hypothetical protein C8T65DRAFT_649881 [Cerioporus squamosus]